VSEQTETASPADAKEVAKVELTDEEKIAILGVHYKRDAKAAAIKYLTDPGRKYYWPRVQPKIIRGRCCLFIDGSSYTDYFGHTWQEAFMCLVFRRKIAAESARSAQLKKEIKKSEVPA
jgi:hypothetical protein